MSDVNQIGELARMIQAGNAVAFSGAGISTESGIADFRSPGGIWSRHKPVLFHDFLNNPAERKRYWQIRRETVPGFLAAEPNAGHRALAALEKAGLLQAIVTQNIDELHQRAGSRCVIEIHGTALRVECLACARRWSCQEIHTRTEAGEEDPTCQFCGGILKSMTISFGQPMPADVFQEAVQLAENCDVFLALGSSLVVQPAASLPVIARRAGAKVAIINREPTPLDEIADLVIRQGIGPTLDALMKLLP